MWVLVLLLSEVLLLVSGVAIDNGVIGQPEVVCDKQGVDVRLRTINPFIGRIFVKGKSKVPTCFQDSGNPRNLDNAQPRFFIPFENCDMSRLRMLNPRGMAYTITVIVSFHPIFITKVDRAYKVSCFYGEITKEITAQLDVSMISTTELTSGSDMPRCEYSVRRDSPDGPIINYAQVGDRVFHRWQCDSDMYGFLVRDCFVFADRGSSEQVEVVNSLGCNVDSVLMEPIAYTQRGDIAYAQSHVFKFADVARTQFSCKIQVCLRSQGACNGITPPRCFAGVNENVPGVTNLPRVFTTIPPFPPPPQPFAPTQPRPDPFFPGPSSFDNRPGPFHRPIRSTENTTTKLIRPGQNFELSKDAILNEMDVEGEMIVLDLEDKPKSEVTESLCQDLGQSGTEAQSACIISTVGFVGILSVLTLLSLLLGVMLCYSTRHKLSPKLLQ